MSAPSPRRSSRPARRDPVHARRLTAQQLAGPAARDPVSATRRLLAIQGQDPRGARLAVRARTRGVTAADVDRALTEERSLLITWCNRGTLHLVASEDYPLLHALTTPPLRTASTARLAREGLDPGATGRGLAVIERELSDGPRTRAQLADALRGANVPIGERGHAHLMFRAALEGICVRGPMIGRQHAYVLVHDWLGPLPVYERDRALAELARRYLTGHGPADARDLARWAGIALGDARAGLAAIASELEIGPDGLVDLPGRRAAPTPPPRLLGTFEPMLLGWNSRKALLGSHVDAVVRGGMFLSFAMAGGRAVATWGLQGSRIAVKPFTTLDPATAQALERDAQAVVGFLGL